MAGIATEVGIEAGIQVGVQVGVRVGIGDGVGVRSLGLQSVHDCHGGPPVSGEMSTNVGARDEARERVSTSPGENKPRRGLTGTSRVSAKKSRFGTHTFSKTRGTHAIQARSCAH